MRAAIAWVLLSALASCATVAQARDALQQLDQAEAHWKAAFPGRLFSDC